MQVAPTAPASRGASRERLASAMLFAPLPPPVGGITSITALLHRELTRSTDVLFRQPLPKTDAWTRAFRPLGSVLGLIRGTLQVRRGGRVLFFCSSGASFWDKCGWAAIVLLLGRRVAMVLVAGNLPETFGRSPRVARTAARWLFRRRGVVIAAQSRSWARTYRGIFPGAAVTRVGATVDPVFFGARGGAYHSGGRVTLLYVGWIIEDKGILDLFDALRECAPVITGRARVRLVGPLFGREAFWQGEARRRGIASLVEIAGAVTGRAAVAEEFRNADAFVFPSHYEGFPVALLEATAAGLPCVATDVGGVSDILDDGVTGLLVRPHCPAELGTAITRLVGDPGLRAALGAAAAQRTARAFSPEECLASYRRLLDVA